jgi:hypothetical protein
MTIAQSVRPSSNPIAITLKRLVALLEEDETDEYGLLKPSQSAFKTAMEFVVESYDWMGDRFPKASAGTDEQGGIRLTWSNLESGGEVRLVCPGQVDRAAYIYHELDSEYAVEHNASVANLVQWLEWLDRV